MVYSEFPFLPLAPSLIAWILLRYGRLNPTLERVVSISVVVGMLYGFAYWLFPDLPLPEKFILGFPMLLSVLITIVWPESKGRIWPQEFPSSRFTLWPQRFILGGITVNLYAATSLLFAFLFPSNGVVPHSSLVPDSIAFPSTIVVWLISIALFLAMLRHHIRSLPPRGK